jgi:hypothetical protein
MVAYSFKSQFAAPIAARTKVQTIRAERKRHARLGETLQLYTAMRTVHCRLIGLAICIGVGEVRLDLKQGRVDLWTGIQLTTPADLDAYAIRDGFADWAAMRLFWAKTHPAATTFTGVAIEWGQTFEEPTDD